MMPPDHSTQASTHRSRIASRQRDPLRAAFAFMAVTIIAACSSVGDSSTAVPGQSAAGATFVDDLGDTVAFGPALRIVSLNPVTTEFLFTAGAGARVVGRTHWDHYPPEAVAVPDMGNGIGPNVEVIVGARPDLVILYATTGNQRAASALHAAGIRTLSIRTDRVADLARFAAAYAHVTGDSAAVAVADTVLASVEAIRALPRPAVATRVFWRIGDPPLYAAGSGGFMGELIEIAGATNVFGEIDAPSPQVSIEEVVRRNPELIIVGPTGAAQVRASPAWRSIPAVLAGRIAVFDTALVARPGVRLGEAARHVRELIYGPGAR